MKKGRRSRRPDARAYRDDLFRKSQPPLYALLGSLGRLVIRRDGQTSSRRATIREYELFVYGRRQGQQVTCADGLMRLMKYDHGAPQSIVVAPGRLRLSLAASLSLDTLPEIRKGVACSRSRCRMVQCLTQSDEHAAGWSVPVSISVS